MYFHHCMFLILKFPATGALSPFILSSCHFLSVAFLDNLPLKYSSFLLYLCRQEFKPSLLRMWSADQQPWHQLETSEKCGMLGPARPTESASAFVTRNLVICWCSGFRNICIAVAQSLSCVQLFCDSMDYSLSGSSIRGISQARILDWIAISSFRD